MAGFEATGAPRAVDGNTSNVSSDQLGVSPDDMNPETSVEWAARPV
jgi:hypothetical protein